MGNKQSTPLDFDALLEARHQAAKDYLHHLYLEGLLEDACDTHLTHEQWHSIGKYHEEKHILKFAGVDRQNSVRGVVQAWDNNGISTLTEYQLAGPIVTNGLLLAGFTDKQIRDAEQVVTKLNAMRLGKKYTTGIAPCVIYEPVCYVHNNLLRYNAVTARQGAYDVKKMTNIYLGRSYGNNNINQHNLLDLVRPLVGGRILSKRVRIGFVMPPNPCPSWKIEDFLNGGTFMSKVEMQAAFSYHFVPLSEDTITVEYDAYSNETLLTLPYMFYVDRKAMSKLVAVPTVLPRGNALQKAGAAVEKAYLTSESN